MLIHMLYNNKIIGPLQEGQAPAAPPPPASLSLGLDTSVTVCKPLFDLLHAGLLA